ncbi:MAG: amidohydrolase [Haliscomenobacteraceae bacterium CHB4]|nr:amidohydrolase [Haliscomenobacteraceae bacterium CHB4]
MKITTALLRSFIASTLIQITIPCFGQITFPKAAPSDERPALFAFTNATIYVDYKTRIEGATLLIRDGKVEACGLKVIIPNGAVVTDCTGKTIYPAFIDLYATDFGLPVPPSPAGGGGAQGGGPGQRPPQPLSNKKGPFSWNEALKPEYSAAEVFSTDAKAAEEWRKVGFGAVLTHRADGISRGTGAFVTLADDQEHETILTTQAAHFLSFRKGTSTQNYPSSLMGCIALIRQTYLDGQWYKTEGYKEERNLSLEAWNAAQSLPQIFEAGDKLDVLRIAQIGKEFNVKYLIKTAGDEYQRLDAIKASGHTLLVPLAFPENYDVKEPYTALNIQLKDLKHWEMAPSNPGRLEAAGIPFALTTAGLKDKSKFWDNLRKAIEYGLSEQTALQALTYHPANFIGLYALSAGSQGVAVGSLEPGKIANFVITSGNIFQKDTKILQNWTQGKPLEVTAPNYFTANPGRLGTYKLQVGKESYTLLLKGKPEAPDAQVMKADSSKVKANLTATAAGLVTLSFQPDTVNKGYIALSGTADTKEWTGRGTLPNGAWTDWRAEFLAPTGPDKPTKQNPVVEPTVGEVIYPFTAFGWKTKPKAETMLIQNATVWTNEKDGIVQNCDVLISNGKIQKIGRQLPVQDNALLVDGTGKHLTAGIIDEHSHIAVSRSVNEGTQESSAEVRIGDVLDAEDIDIYRQLAGGVTSSHLLHGSANPIGGQTQLIKLRWGATPEELKFQNWPGFIKFALGENVKQSNWGDNNRTRYPQTRMGVEQTYVDYFTRAQEYGKERKPGKAYRKDLELEALLEILESKRFITCHSYVQSEITMMMRVAEKFGFKLNTFTHILEGYKVADKMAKHGAGGSSFSDWWAYKYEVYEAIPYNAKMMADRGVLVAINSDDAEMARRLNQEAAKSVLYGGMKEEDAWKMVTLNPAKLLHVDDRVGSIKIGKDADLVLWNENPLSVYARAEKTWVDGILYFDRQEDARLQEEVERERARIIQKLQATPKGEERRERPSLPKKYYDCDSTDDEG